MTSFDHISLATLRSCGDISWLAIITTFRGHVMSFYCFFKHVLLVGPPLLVCRAPHHLAWYDQGDKSCILIHSLCNIVTNSYIQRNDELSIHVKTWRRWDND